jgi:chemotaxis response regulator CheB
MSADKKILIVDDSAFMRKVLRDIFESAGFLNFIEAGNGNEAIEKFKTEKPDFVFLDVIMPDVNGMDVLREIGKEAWVPQVGVPREARVGERARPLAETVQVHDGDAGTRPADPDIDRLRRHGSVHEPRPRLG